MCMARRWRHKGLEEKHLPAQVFPSPAKTCEMSEGTATPTIGNYLLEMEKQPVLFERASSFRDCCSPCHLMQG